MSILEIKMSDRMRRLHVRFYEQAMNYIALKKNKKETASMARSAAKAADAIRDELIVAMAGSDAATCGSLVLCIKRGESIQASFTLKNGKMILLDELTSITVGNQVYMKDEIVNIYGGRARGVELEITSKG
jgi:hypothetical protein